MFAGTGSRDRDIDFNNNPNSTFYPSIKHAAESSLVSMMADCCRIRKGDYIIFYLQANLTKKQEGKFFGIYKAAGDAFLDRNDGNQFLINQLGKNLTFRVRIQPYEVYAKGVTEWKALDEIRHIQSPYQMLWSLIYRKLKGNRGNTMITIYESERLIDLIRRENNNIYLSQSQSYDYDDTNGTITSITSNYQYTGRITPMNILPRLISKDHNNNAYETHLQMYITQNVGKSTSIDTALGILGLNIEWIGNEVSCGVGMQRIDVMLSVTESETRRIIMPIELKAVPANANNITQIKRYIDWIEQYYIPNRISTIQPVLICKTGGLTNALRKQFHDFNISANGRYLPLRYIEYTVNLSNNTINFFNTPY
jgi:predicted RNA-binding protein